jgi:hypothetical protein
MIKGSYEITQTRHPGVLLAGVQQFKELLSDFKVRALGSNRPKAGGPAGFRPEAYRNDEGAISCFVATARVLASDYDNEVLHTKL